MPTVLVVDDAQFVRKRLQKILSEAGFDVLEAGDGQEAVDVYRQYHPDVVLLDITMPKLDGMEALRLIREYDPNARVVMLSALGQQAIILEALRRGARDFIVKPFKPEQVLHALELATRS
ncbi:two-component system, chemotaxis family, response regulator CheY [Ardenticatena maritima]|uniref:Chemotaxis protein CheY n=1 Tax=Ardenticatena maritima TaxID=872965 RepID=A0A0M8K8F5_9CHLR|nr:response regulator [Ardenticatena maritima]KPL88214.1 chemotaxis protein CheY [Ardenticatena maritima]GAP62951.1 two-component system, chemotaxis family, response regulator CheY [Ardenticatena maritima]